MNMSLEENKAIVMQLIEGIDRADFSVFDRVCSIGLRAHFMGTALNREQIEAASRKFSEAFADIRHRIQDVIAEGDRVAVRAVDEVTHSGQFQGIPPTKRHVSFEMIAIYRIQDGKIAEIWEQMDRDGLCSNNSERDLKSYVP